MFYMQKNKEKEATKAKERKEKSDLKNILITDTAETDIRKEQFGRDKAWKETGRHTKANLKDVNMATAVFETEIRKDQHQREKNWKETGRATKEANRDVLITDTAETDIRKEQHQREVDAKRVAKTTKDSNKDVNMAAAVFG